LNIPIYRLKRKEDVE